MRDDVRPGETEQPAGSDGRENRTGLPDGGFASQTGCVKGPPKTPRRVETMGLPQMRSPRGSTKRRVAALVGAGSGRDLALGRLPGGIRGHDTAFRQVHAR